MREQYFTSNSIQDLSRKWLKAFANPKKMSTQQIDINRAALLILDMQRYFLDPDSHAFIPSAGAIIPGLNRLGELFRFNMRPVIASQHINTAEDAGMMSTWWSDLLTDDHPMINLHPDLDIKEGEILAKSQYNAFYQSDLADILGQSNTEQLVVCGVMTHLCCETTAREAFVRGFEVFFPVDGTASYNQKFHQASLQNLAHGFAILTTVEQLLQEE
ncbi:MAG: isochorismatase family protein [Anaerolineales bacterium]